MDEKRRKIRNKCTQLLLKNKKVSDGYERSWSAHCRMFGSLWSLPLPTMRRRALSLSARLT